jgi:hypothetical protein
MAENLDDAFPSQKKRKAENDNAIEDKGRQVLPPLA